MRSILVSTDKRPGCDAHLETAISLARMSGGHVTAAVNLPLAAHVVMDPMGGSYLIAEALEVARKTRDEHAAEVEVRLAGSGVPFDLLRTEGDAVEALAEAARLADIVIVPASSDLAGDLALLSRTPVLVLGEAEPLAFPLASACIGWDGGNEAAVALRSAAPLLASCATVKVITVTEKLGGFPATDALRYLSRHGVRAELEELPRRGSTAETLAIAVAGSGAPLLVMGAYGKSRVREFLFGGVTAHFLGQGGKPALFLAH